MSRKRKTSSVYVATGDDNVIVKEHESVNAVLSYAQRCAEQSEKPCSYLVEHETALGVRRPTHKVWRREDGIVFTTHLARSA